MAVDVVKILLLFALTSVCVPEVFSSFFGVPGGSRVEHSRPRGRSSQPVNNAQKFNTASLRVGSHKGTVPGSAKSGFEYAKPIIQDHTKSGSSRILPVEEKSTKIGSRFKASPHSVYERKTTSEIGGGSKSRPIVHDGVIDPLVVEKHTIKGNPDSLNLQSDQTTESVEFTTREPPVTSSQAPRLPVKTKIKLDNIRIDNKIKGNSSPTFKNARPINTQTKETVTRHNSLPIRNSQVHIQGSPAYATGSAQKAGDRRPSSIFKGRSNLNLAPESRFVPKETYQREIQDSEPVKQQQKVHREEYYDFVPKGNAQIFSPSLNPLGKADPKPKLQELEFDKTRKPLSQDFLPTCPDAKFSYIIPSPTQCDLYYICEYGTPSKELCEDGLVFSIEEVKCVTPDLVDCKERPHLQSPKGSGSCPRRNGIFFSNESCTEFITCRNNQPNYEKCAEGLVFDPKQRICAWADEALRPGCLPDDLLGFTCPNPKLTQEEANEKKVQLRFGDHDRFPDPDDCRFFFMCLITGQPRRAGCGNKKVFDPSTGICRPAKDVPECADYYGAEDDTSVSVSRASRLQRVQEDVSRQLQEERSNLLRLRIKRWIMEAEDAEPE